MAAKGINSRKKRFKESGGFAKVLIQQDNRCPICGRRFDDQKIRPFIDHCHVSKQIRGLLCPQCNAGLGLLGDSVRLLAAAIVYLDQYDCCNEHNEFD